MRRTVLADSGPLYAAADPDDGNHRRAQSELAKLAEDRMSVAVPYSTLLEAYTLVLRRLGLPFAHGWLAEVLEGTIMVNPDPDDYLAAAKLVRAYTDQDITMVDAVLARLSSRLSVPVWSYDHHFRVMQVDVWP